MIRRLWLAALGLLLLLLALPASADIQFYGSGKAMVPVYIYTGSATGNGADLTEDQCLSMQVPGGLMQNVGDTLVVTVNGQYTGNTDTKTARVRLTSISGAVLTTLQANTVANQVWSAQVFITKTGAAGTTTYNGMALGAMGGASGGSSAWSTNIVDTAPWTILVSAQNTTTATANSVTCRYFSVWLIKGP